jgi:hypothetical protein
MNIVLKYFIIEYIFASFIAISITSTVFWLFSNEDVLFRIVMTLLMLILFFLIITSIFVTEDGE